MKILGRITAGLILIAVPMFAHAETVNVEVNNIRVSKGGNVMVLLFTGEGFPIKHDQAVALHTKPANAERLDFKFKNPPSKYIAFKALHDEDGNNKVTKNWTGIWPKEGLGFSNGRQMGALGPPDFEVAKLAVADIVDSVSLTVTYP
jgi:uncharacterized protein (DUF2141 family)